SAPRKAAGHAGAELQLYAWRACERFVFRVRHDVLRVTEQLGTPGRLRAPPPAYLPLDVAETRFFDLVGQRRRVRRRLREPGVDDGRLELDRQVATQAVSDEEQQFIGVIAAAIVLVA